MPTEPKARLNLEIAMSTRDQLHRLKLALGLSSITAVVCLALRVLDRVVTHEGDFVLRHHDGREVVLELFLAKGTD